MKNFYIGTCRYQNCFDNIFPPRLHTTKEILNYLLNYDNIDLDYEYVNFLYGDCKHPLVINDTIKYKNNCKNIFKNIDTLYIEISSIKNYLIDNKYLNCFYIDQYNINKTNMKLIELSKEDILNDISMIKDICYNKLNINKIKIITHVNLKSKITNDYLITRVNLTNILIDVCKKLNIDIILPGEIFVLKYGDIYLEDVLYDGFHYSKIEFPKLITSQV